MKRFDNIRERLAAWKAALTGDEKPNWPVLIKKWWLLELIVLYALCAALVFPHLHVADITAPKREAAAAATETPEPTEKPVKKGENLTTATLAYAGDLVCHMGLNEEASTGDGGYDYKPIMEGALEDVGAADLAFCCLETTFPEDGTVSGYPTFHTPRQLAEDLKAVGFDLIATASNHCMDARQEGLISTLNVLDEVGLDHIGTYRTQEEWDENHGVVVKDINGISIAFLDYTYGTNCYPVTGFEYAVNLCFKDYLEMDAADIDEIDYETLDADLAYARSLDTDLIAVFMHWGWEYYTSPIDYQRELADYLFEQGADLVLGGHPHVPEPMEVRHVRDLEGNERTGYICYCMGNFLSCMNDHYTNYTAVTTLELEKDLDTDETYLKNVSYVPLMMVDTADHGFNGAGWRYRLIDLHKAIGFYEGGDNVGYINETLYNDMKTAVNEIHEIFGARFDRYDPGYQANTKGELPVEPPAATAAPAAETPAG